MSLTIYECPECGNGPETTPLIPGVSLRGDNRRRCPCGYIGEFVPVRLFREEDVRPLWDQLHAAKVTGHATRRMVECLDAFPAPEAWASVAGGAPMPPVPCTAKLYHGPGHQSSTLCRLTGEHEIHEAIYDGHTLARWRDGSYADQLREKGIEVPDWVDEGTAMTGFLDEPPEVD